MLLQTLDWKPAFFAKVGINSAFIVLSRRRSWNIHHHTIWGVGKNILVSGRHTNLLQDMPTDVSVDLFIIHNLR